VKKKLLFLLLLQLNSNKNLKMKKILYAFVFLNLLLVSCSDSENDSPTEEIQFFPKTIKTTFPDFPQDNSTLILTYDGNKILNVVDETTKTKFTYDGNLITKQEIYNLETQGIETIKKRIVYEYESGKLKSKITTSNFDSNHPNGDFIRKEVYTYKSEGIISYSQLDVSVKTNTETKRGDVNLTYKSDNLIKLEEINIDPNISNTVFVFEYDDKNNPLKNILGFNLILNEYSINNAIKKTVKDRLGSSIAVYNSTSIYNTNGYPTKITSFTSDGKTPEYISEYTY
jgi:hypothetical protein